MWEASSSNDLSWSFNTGGNYKLSKRTELCFEFFLMLQFHLGGKISVY
ncbi:MAG: hypothetical protein R3A12_15765 [Ignavibacteria bacterium]